MGDVTICERHEVAMETCKISHEQVVTPIKLVGGGDGERSYVLHIIEERCTVEGCECGDIRTDVCDCHVEFDLEVERE